MNSFFVDFQGTQVEVKASSLTELKDNVYYKFNLSKSHPLNFTYRQANQTQILTTDQ